MTEGVKNNNKV